jgi:Zn-finger nucleic acid-binding protein
MSERSGVEVDYCPKCRGVWLDRGELDKIIEKSSGNGASDDNQNQSRETDHPRDNRQDDDDDFEDDKNYGKQADQSNGNQKRRRGSFLGDIFDF